MKNLSACPTNWHNVQVILHTDNEKGLMVEPVMWNGTDLELWQTWCMRRTENPQNVVRLHEVPQKDGPSMSYFDYARALTQMGHNK